MFGHRADTEKERRKAYALADQATASYTVGRFHAAAEKGIRAAESLQRLGERDAAAKAAVTAGLALTKQERYAESAAAFGQVVDLLEQAGDRTALAAMRHLHGRTLVSAARFEEAIAVLLAASAAYREAGAEEQALMSDATVRTLEKKHDEAVAIWERLLAEREPAGDQIRIAIALFELGQTLQEAARFDEARTAHTRAMTLFRQAGKTDLAANARRGAEGARRGTYPVSALADKRLMTTNPRHREGDQVFGRGMAAMRAKSYPAAIEEFNAAIEIFQELDDPDCGARSYLNLGLALYKRSRTAEAIVSFEQALLLTDATGDDAVRADALQALSVARERS
jgi:tetratricopeptide (TPR) repeat protein